MLPTVLESLPGGKVLRVARAGTGPPLVLLHGYPDTLQVWSRVVPRLAARFETIAFDWPGMGCSSAWPGGATPFHLSNRLRDLLDRWEVQKAGIVAMDMGGQPSLAFAAEHPERTSFLVVMNSLVFGDERTSWEIRILRRFGWNRFLLRRLPRIIFRHAERTSLPPGTELPGELRDDFRRAFLRPEVRNYIIKMCAGYQGSFHRLHGLYGRIERPTLILWGERDRHFPPAHAGRLQEAIPRSRLEIFPGAEHWMAWHRAEEVAERIAACGGEGQG